MWSISRSSNSSNSVASLSGVAASSRKAIDTMRAFEGLQSTGIVDGLLRSSSDGTLKSLDDVTRSLRKLFFSFESPTPGRVSNYVRADDEDLYDDLMKGEKYMTTLECIHYCLEAIDGMENLSGSSPAQTTRETDEERRQRRSIFNHDFLVLHLENKERRGENKHETIYIKAEKVVRPKAGIVLSVYDTSCFQRDQKQIEAFKMKCSGKRITFSSVMGILTNYSKDYSVKESCCWDYARDISKELLRACQRAPEVTNAERQRLQQEIDSVQSRTMGYTLKFEWARQLLQSQNKIAG